MTDKDQLEFFHKISGGDEKAFEKLFRAFYPSLCLFASGILNNKESAEETVQETFLKIWENRLSLHINSSVKNYLFTAVRNRCLNQLQHEKIKNLHARRLMEETSPEIDYSDHFLDPDLARIIGESILSLPEKRREIFRLNREDGLKYKDIAEKLNISLKTVETQMGLALRTLREKLKDFIFPVFFFCFFKNQVKGNPNSNCH